MKRTLLALALCGSALVLGCDKKDEEVTSTVEAPAPAAPAVPAAPAAPAMPAPAATPAAPAPAAPAAAATASGSTVEVENFSWTLPAGWTTKPAAGMRLATLVPPSGPEASIIRLTGDGGGLLMNINRWRGQLMLPPITEAQLAEQTKTVEVSGIKIVTTDIKSPSGRILGAIIPSGSQTYFVKAQGTSEAALDPLVEPLDAFIKSTRVK